MKYLLSAILFFTAIMQATAQDAAMPNDSLNRLGIFETTTYQKFNSEFLERDFHIFVRVPPGYDATDQSYPVVYALDGDSLFPILSPQHLFVSFDEPAVPEAIIVGIAYGSFSPERGNHRRTDYSAPPLEDGDPHGGGARFQRFLKFELMPSIERQFRIDPAKRILVGQSPVSYTHLTLPTIYSV